MKKTDNNATPFSNEFLYSIWNFFAASFSERTQKNYYNIVRDYVKIVNANPDELKPEHAYKYYKHLVEKMNAGRLSRNTAVMRLSVMKTLCDYIRLRFNSQGKEYINYFAEYTIPEEDKTLHEEDIPTEAEIDYILNLTKVMRDRKAYLIFAMAIKCGFTTSEICRLTHDSVMLDKEGRICLRIRENKKVSRIVKLPEDLDKIMKQYLDMVPISEDGYIFRNKRNSNLKVRDAERLLKGYIADAVKSGFVRKEFTLQSMRHAAIKYMLCGGADEKEVADYCGISTKWMSRYNKIVDDSAKLSTADMSIISIKSMEEK